MSPPLEIERKFLLARPLGSILASYVGVVGSCLIEQAYLVDTGEWAIRGRKKTTNVASTHFLTMKRRIVSGVNIEIEPRIDPDEYRQFLSACGTPLLKRRWRITIGERPWDIDEFLNPELDGLFIAEIELPSVGHEFERSEWLGEEVTDRIEYSNYYLYRKINGYDL